MLLCNMFKNNNNNKLGVRKSILFVGEVAIIKVKIFIAAY